MESSNPLLSRNIDLSGTRDETDSMNLQGTVNKAGILMLLCLGAGSLAWAMPEFQMVFILGGLIGGMIACMVGMFKPATTPIAAPAYAVMEGLCLGAISYMLNSRYPGIAVNALMLTFGVLAILLVCYTSRIIRVTDRMVKGVVMATGAIALIYLVNLVMRLFGVSIPFIHQSGPIGIAFSLIVVCIASFNLLVDFSLIENSIRARSPKYMEWYCGMALLVTMVWLYLELLRLLSKLQRR